MGPFLHLTPVCKSKGVILLSDVDLTIVCSQYVATWPFEKKFAKWDIFCTWHPCARDLRGHSSFRCWLDYSMFTMSWNTHCRIQKYFGKSIVIATISYSKVRWGRIWIIFSRGNSYTVTPQAEPCMRFSRLDIIRIRQPNAPNNKFIIPLSHHKYLLIILRVLNCIIT